jgi:hypothetical protein
VKKHTDSETADKFAFISSLITDFQFHPPDVSSSFVCRISNNTKTAERPTASARRERHKLGWILVEYIELTDKHSRLRGPPRDTGFLRIPVLISDWLLPRLWIES